MRGQTLQPGEVVSLLLQDDLPKSKTTTLVATGHLQLIHVVLLAGKTSHTHQPSGETTIQCLEGRVAVTAAGKVQELSAGQMLYLLAAEPHSLKALENSSLLITIAFATSEDQDELDVVQEASKESFPASDPPAW